VQSRNFRAFETYFLIAGVYLLMALALRAVLLAAARKLFARNLRGAR
jgi:polar amino acid transport system permease protein